MYNREMEFYYFRCVGGDELTVDNYGIHFVDDF